MKLPRFVFLTFIATVLALVYVYQQTEIFRLGYQGQKDLEQFQALLDTNANLRYTFKRKTSLVSIGNKISGKSDFMMPENYCLVRLESPAVAARVGRPVKRETMVSRLFGIKRQAEAKTVNPSIAIGLNAD